MTDIREKCPMRHECGNCMPAGGFCTAVNDCICEALHNAYHSGQFDFAAAVKVQQWIPVTERLPDTELETWNDEDGTRGSYEISGWLWGIDKDGTQCRVRYESGPSFQGWYDDNGTTYAISHWMPLPEPPKEE